MEYKTVGPQPSIVDPPKSDDLAWMPFFPVDYLAGTLYFTFYEHGVYCKLLFTQWLSKSLQAVPADPDRLVIGLGLRELPAAVRAKLIEIDEFRRLIDPAPQFVAAE